MNRDLTSNIWWVISVCALFQLSFGTLITVPINQLGYSFTAPTKVNGVSYNYIIDTGNYQFSSSVNTLQYNKTFTGDDDTSSAVNPCLSLYNDESSIQFIPNLNCSTTWAKVFIGTTAQANVLVTPDLSMVIENPLLHQWSTANGDIGMGYPICSTQPCTEVSAFETILQDVSLKSFTSVVVNGTTVTTITYYDLVFGLDFNPVSSPFESISSVPSTLQLGGIEKKYRDDIVWLTQPDPVGYLKYHEFYIQDFQVCEADILFPYGTNWQVIVDTGCACMILPEEVYQSVLSYFDNSTIFYDTDLVNMPAFSFNTQFTAGGDNSSTFYIPFANLIVNATDFNDAEEGAPYVNIMNSVTNQIEVFRLCILSGDPIVDSYTAEYLSPPLITLGSMAMSTIYFAADFNAGSVGLANKLNSTEINYFNSSVVKGCKAVAQCTGDQIYKQQFNYCKEPKCDAYFFVELDKESHTCVWKAGDVGFGLFVILGTLLIEVVCYFVMQYSAYSSVTQNNRDRRSIWFLTKKGLDPLTILIGKLLCLIVDPILIALKWVPSATTTPRDNPTPTGRAGGARGIQVQALGNRGGDGRMEL